MLNKIALPLFISTILLSFNAWAEGGAKPLDDPSLIVELQQEQNADEYADTQLSTVKFFEDLNSSIKSLSSGGSASPKYLNAGEIHYLTGVYLHCAMKNAACPMILDAILELDVIDAKLNNNNECKNLLALWDRWVKNDFEKRLNYSLTKGLARFLEFKKNQRPRYLRCTKTVEEETKFTGSTADYFKKRYALDTPASTRVSKFLQYLHAIQEKQINVFVATGAYKQ